MSGDKRKPRLRKLLPDEDDLLSAWVANIENGNDQLLHQLADQFEELGLSRELRGDLPGALRNFDRTHELRAKLARRDRSHAPRIRALSGILTRLGGVYCKLGDLPTAIRRLVDACELRRRLVEQYPEDARYRYYLERAQKKLWDAEHEQSRLEEAEQQRAARKADCRRSEVVAHGRAERSARDAAQAPQRDRTSDVMRRSERVEPERVEPVRVEPVRVEPVRVEPVRVEPVRAEPERNKKAPAVDRAPNAADAAPAAAQDGGLGLLVADAARAAKLSVEREAEAHQLRRLLTQFRTYASQFEKRAAFTAALLSLDQASSAAMRLSEAAPRDAESRLNLAAVLRDLGRLQRKRGMFAAAEKNFHNSRHIAEQLVRDDDGIAPQLALCRSLEGLALVRAEQGHVAHARVLVLASRDARSRLASENPGLPRQVFLPRADATIFNFMLDTWGKSPTAQA